MNHKDPSLMVSVFMVTYGHEKFVRQAVESVLMQETEYSFELIIGNDCSPDNTDNIIQEILRTHPKASHIKYLRHAKNLGSQGNSIWALKQATGKYIAICEGDDYWTDPDKLQTQVSFMEQHPECCLCAGYVGVLEADATKVIYPAETPEKTLYLDDIILNNSISTLTALFRNIPDKSALYKALENNPLGDWTHYSFIGYVTRGNFHIFPKVFGVYRHHGGGIFSSLNSSRRILLGFQTMKLTDVVTEGNYSYLSVLSDICLAQWNKEPLDQTGYIKDHLAKSQLSPAKRTSLLALLSGSVGVSKVLEQLSPAEKNISVISYVLAILYKQAAGKVGRFAQKVDNLLKEMGEKGLDREPHLAFFITGYWLATFRLFPGSMLSLLDLRKYKSLFSYQLQYKEVAYLHLSRFKWVNVLFKWKQALGL